LSDPNRGLCTLGEIWCKEQRNEKQTAQRFGLPRRVKPYKNLTGARVR
jgi:hypothetical protein